MNLEYVEPIVNEKSHEEYIVEEMIFELESLLERDYVREEIVNAKISVLHQLLKSLKNLRINAE